MNISWNILSKYRNELYGISILWVIFLHGLNFKRSSTPYFLEIFEPLLKHGNCGVEIFLFLSGIFLYFSMEKDSNIYSFWKKRLKRILIPFILIDGVYWGYVCIIKEHDIFLFIKNITFYSFWFEGNPQVWFIATIIFLYFIYPFIYSKILKNQKINRLLYIILFCALSYLMCYIFKSFTPQWYRMVEIGLTRIPVFLIGSYCGILVYSGKAINTNIKFLSLIFVLVGLGYFYVHPISLINNFRIPYLLVGPSLAIWISVCLEIVSSTKGNRLLSLWGGLSLELYLSHVVLRKIFLASPIYGKSAVANFHKYLIFVLLGAYVISKLVVYVQEKVILKVNHDNK